jgi:regulator of sirC expression with transglutaminase-like and TPR domain
MGFREKMRKVFQTTDGEIERAYNAYDRASDLLTARDKNPVEFNRTQELQDALKEAESLATELLKKYEGVKSWPGIFREMHMNLARLWLKTEKFDDAMKACDKVAEYGAADAEELREAVREAMSGKKLEATSLDEVGVA